MMACVFYGPMVLPGFLRFFLSRYPMRWCCLFIPRGWSGDTKVEMPLNPIISLQLLRTRMSVSIVMVVDVVNSICLLHHHFCLTLLLLFLLACQDLWSFHAVPALSFLKASATTIFRQNLSSIRYGINLFMKIYPYLVENCRGVIGSHGAYHPLILGMCACNEEKTTMSLNDIYMVLPRTRLFRLASTHPLG